MGANRVTVKNLKVKGVDASKNILLIQGALPGPQKSLLLFKASSRAKVKE
jgi:large subunit ribosomal protein L3